MLVSASLGPLFKSILYLFYDIIILKFNGLLILLINDLLIIKY